MMTWLSNLISSAPAMPPLPTLTTATPEPPAAPAAEQGRRTAKLVMVTAANNNKFYDMRDNGDGTFSVTYGRVGSRGATAVYPMSLWESKIQEKIRKGYRDQTSLFGRAATDDLEEIEAGHPDVQALLRELLGYARSSIRHHYLVTAEEVSPRQVREAQMLLDALVMLVGPGLDVHHFNQTLLDLFRVIPRKMSRVQDHLLRSEVTTTEALNELRGRLADEQATLDVMRGEVERRVGQEDVPRQRRRLIDALGLEITPVTDAQVVRYIRQQMGEDAELFHRAYQVTSLNGRRRFDHWLENAAESKKTRLLWHGSRNENWLSILQTGLVLRPANAIITGKMFGLGLYFADKFRKSLNYSSLRGSFWAAGSQERAFLALYEVHTGRPLKVTHHQPWCGQLTEANLRARDARYDSVFARGGADLVHNEYIVYNEAQCTVRYLVEVRG